MKYVDIMNIEHAYIESSQIHQLNIIAGVAISGGRKACLYLAISAAVIWLIGDKPNSSRL